MPQDNTLFQRSTVIDKSRIVTNKDYLFIDPLLVILGVLNESLREPELDLTLSRLHRIRSMDNVVSHIAAEISTNGTRSSLERLGGAHHLTSNSNNVVSLPHHGNNSRRAHETSKARIETLTLVLSIVLLKKRHRRNEHLQTNELESLLLEASNNLPNATTLDSIRLDSNKSSLLQHEGLYQQNTRGISTIFVVMP